jgi:hypothetical protein
MQQAVAGTPVQDFANVTPLEKVAATQMVHVDTQDTAPPSDAAEQGLPSGAVSSAPKSTPPKSAPITHPVAPGPQAGRKPQPSAF